jgi:hypothetical protein
MSYLTTALLVNPDKKQGREMARKMMEFFYTELPGAYEKAKKQYAIFSMLNSFHVSRKTFEAVLHSKVYNRLRKNHDFE